MEGKWSCYRGGQFREGEWSYYVGGQFNGGRMIMLQRWIVSWRENGHVTKVVTNGGENGHVTDVASLKELEWFCYRGGLFNGGGLVMLWRGTV